MLELEVKVHRNQEKVDKNKEEAWIIFQNRMSKEKQHQSISKDRRTNQRRENDEKR